MTILEKTPHRVPGRPALRARGMSVVWRPRYVVVLAVGVAALVLGMAANIGRGEYPISIPDVLAVLMGGGDSGQQFIILELRLPRSLTGALVGGARPPIGMSLVVGAALTVIADVVARTAFGATELPVGIVTAVLGAPYLLYLLARYGREARA